VVESSEDQNGDERKAPVIELWYGFYGILKRVRLVAILVAVALAGLFTGQGEDVLRSLVEGPDYLGLIVLYFGMLLWAVSAWYWSRVLLNYEFPDDPSLDKTAWAGFWRAVLPRLLGALGIVGLGLALAMIGGFNAWFCAGIAWALGGVYLFFVILRRRLFPAFFPAGTTIMVEDWPGLLAAYVDDLGRVARILLTLSLVVGLALFVLLTLFPVTIGAMFGTAGIFLLWASTMIPLAGLADLLTRRTRFPILLAVVAWGIVLSLWVDNHDLQRADEEVQPRQAARDHFAAWSERRLAGVEGEAVDRPIPVFFVASEGGGIRSAYWTAAILGYLQDHDDRFGRQLYAISGVSGGSMGAAVFAAELAAVTLPHPGAGAICPSLTPWSGFKSTGTEMLGRDYLAPIVGALLYPDTFQRIWPISISRLDRARAFEEAWRVNWLKACGLSLGNEPANPFARSFAFQNLWLEDRLYAVPQLLLNTTQVGTGRRAVTSSLAWSDDGEAPPYLVSGGRPGRRAAARARRQRRDHALRRRRLLRELRRRLADRPDRATARRGPLARGLREPTDPADHSADQQRHRRRHQDRPAAGDQGRADLDGRAAVAAAHLLEHPLGARLGGTDRAAPIGRDGGLALPAFPALPEPRQDAGPAARLDAVGRRPERDRRPSERSGALQRLRDRRRPDRKRGPPGRHPTVPGRRLRGDLQQGRGRGLTLPARFDAGQLRDAATSEGTTP
jgi:hypothetical protein